MDKKIKEGVSVQELENFGKMGLNYRLRINFIFVVPWLLPERMMWIILQTQGSITALCTSRKKDDEIYAAHESIPTKDTRRVVLQQAHVSLRFFAYHSYR